MEAAVLVKLIIEVGLPAALEIADWVTAKKTIGPNEIIRLREMGAKRAADYLAAAGGAPVGS